MIQLRYRLLFEVMMRCLVMLYIFRDELDDIYYVNVIVLVSDSGKCRSHKEKTFCPLPTDISRNFQFWEFMYRGKIITIQTS